MFLAWDGPRLSSNEAYYENRTLNLFCLRLYRRARKQLKLNFRDTNYLGLRLFTATGIHCDPKEYWLAVNLIILWCKEWQRQSRGIINRNLCVYSKTLSGTSIKKPATAVGSYRGRAFLSVQKPAHYLECPGPAGSEKNCLSRLPSLAARQGAARSSWEAHRSSSDESIKYQVSHRYWFKKKENEPYSAKVTLSHQLSLWK